jgi:FAD/FMN-containing dehydrogenase
MSIRSRFQSWGRYPPAEPACVVPLRFRDRSLPRVAGSLLAFGNGRSYGDSCLNNGGCLLATRGMDRFLAFDPANGIVRCESGVLLGGLIVWAELRLKRIANPYVQVGRTRFDALDGFFDLALSCDRDYEYTVAWIDCLASGRRLGRGIFMAGNHATPACEGAPRPPAGRLSVPLEPPWSLVSRPTLKAFNEFFFRKQSQRVQSSVEHYAPFFYPLDGIAQWNRIYGPKGFLQYQSVVPIAVGRAATREMLQCIARSGQGSFLSVFKVFGDRPPVGLLSFPRPGVTLALDFPNKGQDTLRLLDTLDSLVAQAGGAIYPAKDARMSPRLFASGYPGLATFRRYLDPAFSSSFWRRVTGESV